MSWQNQWGTVKATNAKAAALYFEVANVGKTIESSKKRVTWRLKVEEGREFEISLTHSLASGKKVLRIDGIVKYTSQSLSFGDWDYVFNLTGGHCVHIIIKPSVDLNDMYDLIVDGMSFRRLPTRLDPSTFQKSQNNGVTSATRTTIESGSAPSSSYNYSNGSYNDGSRNNSFSPWECTRCTLVNEKVHAPICEACGHPKPEYISMESRQRAKTVALAPNPPLSLPRPTAKSTIDAPIAFDMWQETPRENATSSVPFPAFTDVDGFPTTSRTSTLPNGPSVSPQDITSMLSGLDFTTCAPNEGSLPPVEAAIEPTPTVEDSLTSKDLWTSGMINLNLKPEEAIPTQLSAKRYQTMEQARQLAPKEKVQVLPTSVYNSAQVPAGMYGGMSLTQPIMYNPVGNAGAFGMTSGQMEFNTPQMNTMHPYAAFSGQQAAFMTTGPMNGPPRPSPFGNDPFATLS